MSGAKRGAWRGGRSHDGPVRRAVLGHRSRAFHLHVHVHQDEGAHAAQHERGVSETHEDDTQQATHAALSRERKTTTREDSPAAGVPRASAAMFLTDLPLLTPATDRPTRFLLFRLCLQRCKVPGDPVESREDRREAQPLGGARVPRRRHRRPAAVGRGIVDEEEARRARTTPSVRLPLLWSLLSLILHYAARLCVFPQAAPASGPSAWDLLLCCCCVPPTC